MVAIAFSASGGKMSPALDADNGTLDSDDFKSEDSDLVAKAESLSIDGVCAGALSLRPVTAKLILVAAFFFIARGFVTRSVISMITEPMMGPEHCSPSRRHWLQNSGVSSHYRITLSSRPISTGLSMVPLHDAHGIGCTLCSFGLWA